MGWLIEKEPAFASDLDEVEVVEWEGDLEIDTSTDWREDGDDSVHAP